MQGRVNEFSQRDESRLHHWNNFSDSFTGDESIGDMFDTYCAVKAFNGEAGRTMVLMDMVFFDHFALTAGNNWKPTRDSNREAIRHLAIARTWVTGADPPPRPENVEPEDGGVLHCPFGMFTGDYQEETVVVRPDTNLDVDKDRSEQLLETA